jgi:hypothetical protein
MSNSVPGEFPADLGTAPLAVSAICELPVRRFGLRVATVKQVHEWLLTSEMRVRISLSKTWDIPRWMPSDQCGHCVFAQQF